jgi:hypothetical protein
MKCCFGDDSSNLDLGRAPQNLLSLNLRLSFGCDHVVRSLIAIDFAWHSANYTDAYDRMWSAFTPCAMAIKRSRTLKVYKVQSLIEVTYCWHYYFLVISLP